MYVTEWDNHRVQVFGLDGAVLRMWGSEGAGQGQLKTPFGVAVHGRSVYVTELENQRVQVFGLDGAAQRMWLRRCGGRVIQHPTWSDGAW